MTEFVLGKPSLLHLAGVHPDLVKVVKHAIELTTQDFGVHEGLRSRAQQAKNVAAGVSHTSKSRHLDGHAVDLVPYVGGQLRWEWPLIYPIAVAMARAAAEFHIPIRWGGNWLALLEDYYPDEAGMKKAVKDYCDIHPGPDFLDGPHYELPRSAYP